MPTTSAVFAVPEALLRDGSHSATLRELLTETARFTQAFSGEHFAYNLFVPLENIDARGLP